MNTQRLRKQLEKSHDKLKILSKKRILNSRDFNMREYLDLVLEFLSDEEKVRLFDYKHFSKCGKTLKTGIINLISDEKAILQVLSNDNIAGDFSSYQIADIIEKASDGVKIKILHDQEFIEKYKLIDNYKIGEIIDTLSDSEKTKILMDKDLIINKLHLSDYQIAKLTEEITNYEEKRNVIEVYKLEKIDRMSAISTMSTDRIIDIVLKDDSFDKNEKIQMLKLLDTKALGTFLVEHKEFCNENDIKPYEIIFKLPIERQKKFADNLQNLDLSKDEKREIIAILDPEVKQSINITIQKEYEKELSMKVNEYGSGIIIDWDRDLEDYRGLDNVIKIKPEEYTEEQRTKSMKLCNICLNLRVGNDLQGGEHISTAGEYKNAEEWINSVISMLKPEYSNVQKMAIIDNAIGKKISYSPDYKTEVCDEHDVRAIWKIIDSGYGVCNGIAAVEKYIFDRIGIESELVNSEEHTFVKVKNIELPLANGETVKGNTILDSTWNLAINRFDGKPENFCISYEQARKNDIDEYGKDSKCHENDKQLQDANIGLDEQSLRKLYTSVGLADKDGKFPIGNLMMQSKILDYFFRDNPKENINKQLLLLSKEYPEFIKCQNSSMRMIETLLNKKNLKFKRCVINRVYNREDKEKRPIIYVYINSDEIGENFYFADKNTKQFIELSEEEFTKKFECYEKDLEKNNRIRPWEIKEKVKENVDLSKSSGKIIAKEGNDR